MLLCGTEEDGGRYRAPFEHKCIRKLDFKAFSRLVFLGCGVDDELAVEHAKSLALVVPELDWPAAEVVFLCK